MEKALKWNNFQLLFFFYSILTESPETFLYLCSIYDRPDVAWWVYLPAGARRPYALTVCSRVLEYGHAHPISVQPRSRGLLPEPNKHLFSTSSLLTIEVIFCFPKPRPSTTTWVASKEIWMLGLHQCKRWCSWEKKMCVLLQLCLRLSPAVNHEMLGCWSKERQLKAFVH